MRDIVAREDRAEDEGNRTCRTIDQTIVLIGERDPALSDLILEEDRSDLHRKPFAQAVEEDKDQVEIDMLLLKERDKDLHKLLPALIRRAAYTCSLTGEATHMI